MGMIKPFRIWYYFKNGYKQYFAFVFAALNMMVVTYYLAIERAPFLKEIFPSFGVYAAILILVGFPILIITGFAHFRRTAAFKAQSEIHHEANPYVYKLGPGYQRVTSAPHTLMMSKLMLKLMTNQKITEDEIKTMEKLQKKMQFLIDGGSIAHKSVGKLPFKVERENSKEFDE